MNELFIWFTQQDIDSVIQWNLVDSAEILVTETITEINTTISKKCQNP